MYIQVKSGAKREIISQPLYDNFPLTAAVTTATLFAVPLGSGGKTIVDTNMRLAGQLPRPQSFHITSVSCQFFQAGGVAADATTVNEIQALINEGALSLTVGSKVMLEGPIGWFVAGFGPTGNFAGSLGVDHLITSNGNQGHINKWPLKYRIVLDVNENFSVTMTWNTATPAKDWDLLCVLDGYLVRSIQ